MTFNKITAGLAGLKEEPAFRIFSQHDINPLGGTDKVRMFYAPNDAMRLIHTRLRRFLRPFCWSLPQLTACRPGDSTRKNVQRHLGNRYFYLTDLHSAYGFVNPKKLAAILCDSTSSDLIGRYSEVLRFLKRFCFAEETGLATGAPASPDLFNLYGDRLLDRSLSQLCQENQLTYTRYLDDLTFSSKVFIGKGIRRDIRRVIVAAGFQVSHCKSQILDIQKGPITITGIRLDKRGRMFLPQSYRRRIKGIINEAIGGRVSPQTVNGFMGAFWLTARGRSLTHSELKILARYQQLRQHFRRIYATHQS